MVFDNLSMPKPSKSAVCPPLGVTAGALGGLPRLAAGGPDATGGSTPTNRLESTPKACCRSSRKDGYSPGAGRLCCGTQFDWPGSGAFEAFGGLGGFGGFGGFGTRTFFTFGGLGSL